MKKWGKNEWMVKEIGTNVNEWKEMVLFDEWGNGIKWEEKWLKTGING